MPPAVDTAIETVDDVGSLREEIERLAAESSTVGESALNEAALLELRRPRPGLRHFLARAEPGGPLVGYAQLAAGDEADTGHVLVAPAYRRRGIGRRLLDAVLAEADRPVQIWAHDDTPAAAALAKSAGLDPVRALSVMTRVLDDDLPQPALPAGVRIRSFRPGSDEDAWLAVNARAFADHPEQGRITRADLTARMGESWFDPAGFLLAERDEPGEGVPSAGQVVGFHWTKQHPGRLGEVYVIGVDPDAAGGGLGKALLYAGLRHLRSAGDTEVELYVESDHPTALGLYRGAGFVERSRDVLYRSSVTG